MFRDLIQEAYGAMQYNRGYTPGHAEHGEGGAPAVMAHGIVGFLEQVSKHRSINSWVDQFAQLHISKPPYSCLSASTGSSRAALFAG